MQIVGYLVAFILMCVYVVSAILFRGWVLVQLWAWFVTPTFNTVVLTFGQALGISLIVSFLTYQHVPVYKGLSYDMWRVFLSPFIQAGVALAAGWLYLYFFL